MKDFLIILTCGVILYVITVAFILSLDIPLRDNCKYIGCFLGEKRG